MDTRTYREISLGHWAFVITKYLKGHIYQTMSNTKPQSTGQYRVTGGAPTRKVLLGQERWELSKLPAPGLKEHLSDAIVARSGEDARIV